jgi:hypothetical protein
VTEQGVSKDEALKQSTELKGDATISVGKLAPEEVPKPQKQKGVTRDKDQREKEVKEELKQRTAPPSATEAPLAPVLTMKKEVHEKPSRGSEPSNQQLHTDQKPGVPAESDQKTDSAEEAPGRDEKVDRRAFSARLQVGALSEKRMVALDVTLHVRDAKAVKTDVENLLGQLGAQNIRKDSLQSTEIFTAELQAEKTQELLEKLKLLGEVKEKGLPPENPEETIKIRIEMMSPP